MNLGRVAYRSRQVLLALHGQSSPEGLATAQKLLTASQMALFRCMQTGEQAHSLKVMGRLLGQGEADTDLLIAALLHDIGKTRAPLRLWERVLIVLVKRFSPQSVKIWGIGVPRGWKRPFVVAEQHPHWGAKMALEAGISPRAIELIRNHQHPLPDSVVLQKLQAADDQS